MQYKFWKSKNPESKGTIVFIHGFATTSDYFDDIAKMLNEDYDYYALELPGLGVTKLKSKKDLSPLRYAKIISDWLESNKLKDVYLIGHSMGGGVVNMVANLCPEKIKKLITICPMSSTIHSKVFNSFKIYNRTAKKSFKNAKVIYRRIEDKYPLKEKDPELLKRVEYLISIKKNIRTLFWNMCSVKNFVNLNKAQKNISVPTLLITGEFDNIIDSKATSKKLTKNKNISWVEIRDAGHETFFEQPKETYKVIYEFLNKQ